jgi:hypothetical protein
MISIKRDYPLAPALPPDFVSDGPDVVCIGAMRSGTTRLAFLFNTHPEFYYASYLKPLLKQTPLQFISLKERHFFERTNVGLTDEQIAEYRKWFPKPAGAKTGEFTPRYMFDYWVAEQLKVAAPKAKLIVMLRDPVERFWSGCQFSGNIHPNTFNEHFQRGLYAEQLERWYQHYDRDSVIVIQYEKFNKDPMAGYAEVCRFIGIDDKYQPADDQMEAVVNAGQPRPVLPENVKANLVDSYRSSVEKLMQMQPHFDKKLWKNFA